MAYRLAYDKGLRPVLDAIDAVSKMLGQKLGIELPKIAVVGDQSSGKSSLLESIFGFALPRGENIVTRTPIQVEHRHSASENAWAEVSYRLSEEAEWSKERVEGLEGIEDAVDRATTAVAGEGKDVVDNIIYLRVYSNLLPDLTVLDLPGITRNALEGQSEDIEEVITTLINNHIAGAMTVLLCVVQANVDFSTAASIKIARNHDPERDRTLESGARGVVTKSDLVEPGSDFVARVEGSGQNLKLKLGFIPVRNRTTEELKLKVPLSEVRRKEEDFFRARLPQLPADRRGVGALVKLMAEVQFKLIEKSLPALKKQVQEKLAEQRGKLREMQGRVVSGEIDAQLKASALVNDLVARLYQLRVGDYVGLDRQQQPDGMKVARRVWEMADRYRQELEEQCCPGWFLGEECFGELKEMSKDLRGTALPNFLSHPIFVALFRRRVYSVLLEPSLSLVAEVKSYMEEVLCTLVDATCEAFPKFAIFAKDQVQALLSDQDRAARELVEQLVRQQGVVLTLNPAYIEVVDSLKASATQVKEGIQRMEYSNSTKGWESDATQQQLQALGAEKEKLKEGFLKRSDNLGQGLYDAVMRLAESKSTEDQGLMEMQFCLLSYSQVVLKRLDDMVALGVRQLLVEDVGDKLAECIQRGLLEATAPAAAEEAVKVNGGADGALEGGGAAGPSGLLALMQDAMQSRRKQALERTVKDLEEAWKQLKRVSM